MSSYRFTINCLVMVFVLLFSHQNSYSQSDPPIDPWIIEGDQAGALLGADKSVASAGDVNGDGYDDVIVGALNYDAGLTDNGVVRVYHGSCSGLADTGNPDWEYPGETAGMGFGFSDQDRRTVIHERRGRRSLRWFGAPLSVCRRGSATRGYRPAASKVSGEGEPTSALTIVMGWGYRMGPSGVSTTGTALRLTFFGAPP